MTWKPPFNPPYEMASSFKDWLSRYSPEDWLAAAMEWGNKNGYFEPKSRVIWFDDGCDCTCGDCTDDDYCDGCGEFDCECLCEEQK